VTAANGASESDRGPGDWRIDRDHPDSIVIAWSNGFTGAWVSAAAASDSLRGRLRAFVDVVPFVGDVAEFVAHRVTCAASGAH